MAKRITGHSLKHEGERRYDRHGHAVDREDGTHGKCQCGEVFKADSDRGVKQQHREHKQRIIRESGGAA